MNDAKIRLAQRDSRDWQKGSKQSVVNFWLTKEDLHFIHACIVKRVHRCRGHVMAIDMAKGLVSLHIWRNTTHRNLHSGKVHKYRN